GKKDRREDERKKYTSAKRRTKPEKIARTGTEKCKAERTFEKPGRKGGFINRRSKQFKTKIGRNRRKFAANRRIRKSDGKDRRDGRKDRSTPQRTNRLDRPDRRIAT